MAELVGPKKEDNDWYDQLLEAYSNMDPKSKKKMYEILIIQLTMLVICLLSPVKQI